MNALEFHIWLGYFGSSMISVTEVVNYCRVSSFRDIVTNPLLAVLVVAHVYILYIP